MSKSKKTVVYIGGDVDGVWTGDGTHFPHGVAVSVESELADRLLMQSTFTTMTDRKN